MRYILVLAALIAVGTAATVFTKKAPLYGDGNGAKDGEYIVVFQKNLDQQLVAKHLDAVSALKKQIKIRKQFHIGSLRAYSVEMEDDALEAIRMMPEVRYVERNGIVHATVLKQEKLACASQNSPTWGLARVSKRDAYTGGDPYSYDDDPNGNDIDLYVIDTGIRTTHVDFAGRATEGADCYASLTCAPAGQGDPNGHGTHVASTAGGVTYGVAKKANLISVRVLSAGGSGSYEQVVAGVEWVTKEREEKNRRSVANMSLGGASSTLLDDAVNEAVNKGVHMIVAAGNEFQNACNRSPAGANGVTAVGATDRDDQAAYFTNYGECVEIFAPGVDVIAAYGTSDTAIATLSGTSMASPHVAGVVADILSKRNTEVAPGEMEEYIKDIATKGKINGLPPGHTGHDDLVYKDCATD